MANTNNLGNESIVANYNIKAGMLSGFIASAFSSLVLILFSYLALTPQFDFVLIQGSIFGLAGSALSAWIMYFIIGTFIWGILYSFTQSKLNGTNVTSKGLIAGIIIWVIIMSLFMPLTEAGFFTSRYGFGAAVIVLLTDIVFGLVLAYFYQKLRNF